jgi:hypothetical protein
MSAQAARPFDRLLTSLLYIIYIMRKFEIHSAAENIATYLRKVDML